MLQVLTKGWRVCRPLCRTRCTPTSHTPQHFFDQGVQCGRGRRYSCAQQIQQYYRPTRIIKHIGATQSYRLESKPVIDTAVLVPYYTEAGACFDFG